MQHGAIFSILRHSSFTVAHSRQDRKKHGAENMAKDERQPMTLSASTSRSTGERPNSELENAGPSTSTSPRSTESRQRLQVINQSLLLERISLIRFLLNILCFSSLLSNKIF